MAGGQCKTARTVGRTDTLRTLGVVSTRCPACFDGVDLQRLRRADSGFAKNGPKRCAVRHGGDLDAAATRGEIGGVTTTKGPVMKPIVALSSEEYSDYSIHGYFLAPSLEFVHAAIREWREKHPEQEQKYKADLNAFFVWFAALPEVETFDGITEVWVGAYSTWNNYKDELQPKLSLEQRVQALEAKS